MKDLSYLSDVPVPDVTVADRAVHCSVPFFTQAATFETLWPLIRAHLDDVMDRGKYSHGRKVAEFETALAEWTGARHVVGVNSGTDALVLLLRACGLRPRDQVVVPAFSFIASASAVVLAGGQPVFADIDPLTYAIDPRSLAQVVTPRTECHYRQPAPVRPEQHDDAAHRPRSDTVLSRA